MVVGPETLKCLQDSEPFFCTSRLQTESFTRSHANKRAEKKASTAEKHPFNSGEGRRERERRIKEAKMREWSKDEDRQAAAEGFSLEILL